MIIELGKVTEETKQPLNPHAPDNTTGDQGLDI
jgi:hypothetical protein